MEKHQKNLEDFNGYLIVEMAILSVITINLKLLNFIISTDGRKFK